MRTKICTGHSSRNSGWQGWASGAASAVAYGTMPVAAVFAFDAGASPAVLLTLRGMFAAAVIAALWLLTGRARKVPLRPALGLIACCGPLFGAQVLAFFMAVERGGAQIPVIVVNVCPLFVIGLVWLRDRTPVPRVLIVLACAAIAGLILVSVTGTSVISLSAVGLTLFSAAGYAAYLVASERWVHEVGTVAAAGLVTVGATVSIGVFAAITGQSFDVSGAVWTTAAIQGLILMPIGMGGALYAVRTLGSVPLSLLGALEPAAGIALAATVLGESLAPIQWIGVATILATCATVPLVARRQDESVAVAQHPLNGIGAGESPLADDVGGGPT